MRATRDNFPTPNWLMPWVSARFYQMPSQGTLSAQTIPATFLVAMPFFCPNTAGVTISQLGLEISTFGTNGHVMRISFYEDFHGRPGGLLKDWGTLPVGDAEIPEAVPVFVNTTDHGTTSTQFLPQGWFWVAISSQSGTARAYSTTNIISLMTRSTQGSVETNFSMWATTPTATQMAAWTVLGHPDNFPLEQAVPDQVAGPRILLKVT